MATTDMTSAPCRASSGRHRPFTRSSLPFTNTALRFGGQSGGRLPDLVDVLAYTLARIIVSFEARVAGHILQQMGRHVTGLTESMQAERAAEREVQELKEQRLTTH